MKYINEINKRKTFAIISHPDAGKTTLTEKFLLFGGAIQSAGAVKSNKIISKDLLIICPISEPNFEHIFFPNLIAKVWPFINKALMIHIDVSVDCEISTFVDCSVNKLWTIWSNLFWMTSYLI